MTERIPLHEGDLIRPAVDLFIVNEANTHVLLAQRTSAVGRGLWSFIGGHQKSGEMIEYTIEREIHEELGEDVEIDVTDEIVAFRENNLPPKFRQHNTLILKGIYRGGELRINLEENSAAIFFPFDQLPEELFSGVEQTVELYKLGKPRLVSDWKK